MVRNLMIATALIANAASIGTAHASPQKVICEVLQKEVQDNLFYSVRFHKNGETERCQQLTEKANFGNGDCKAAGPVEMYGTLIRLGTKNIGDNMPCVADGKKLECKPLGYSMAYGKSGEFDIFVENDLRENKTGVDQTIAHAVAARLPIITYRGKCHPSK